MLWPADHALEAGEHVGRGEGITVGAFLFKPDEAGREKPETHDF